MFARSLHKGESGHTRSRRSRKQRRRARPTVAEWGGFCAREREKKTRLACQPVAREPASQPENGIERRRRSSSSQSGSQSFSRPLIHTYTHVEGERKRETSLRPRASSRRGVYISRACSQIKEVRVRSREEDVVLVVAVVV